MLTAPPPESTALWKLPVVQTLGDQRLPCALCHPVDMQDWARGRRWRDVRAVAGGVSGPATSDGAAMGCGSPGPQANKSSAARSEPAVAPRLNTTVAGMPARGSSLRGRNICFRLRLSHGIRRYLRCPAPDYPRTASVAGRANILLRAAPPPVELPKLAPTTVRDRGRDLANPQASLKGLQARSDGFYARPG